VGEHVDRCGTLGWGIRREVDNLGGNGFRNPGLEFDVHGNIVPAMVVGLNKFCHKFPQLRMDGCRILEEVEVLELRPKFGLVETTGLEIGVEVVILEGSGARGIKLCLILSCSRSRIGRERI